MVAGQPTRAKPPAGPLGRWRGTVAKDFRRNKVVYLILSPILLYYVIFNYIPMNGIVMAFQRYSPGLGIWRSPFVGLTHFKNFFGGYFFLPLLRNTFLISFYNLLFGFPAPILLALLFNELRTKSFKKLVQTVTYIPNFISTVVIVGIARILLRPDGVINYIAGWFGAGTLNFLAVPGYFRTILISIDILQGVGYGTVIYLAAIASLGTEIYEAAMIDGAGRWKQAIHLTLPGLVPTITILLIFRIASLLSVGTEKILLLYNDATLSTADVIGTYVYRKGLVDLNYSFASAVGLLNSVVSMVLLAVSNQVAKFAGDTSLW